MIEIIHKIEQFIPLLIIVSLTISISIERLFPYLRISKYRSKQRWHNIAFLLVTFILSIVLSSLVSLSFTIAEANNFGLLRLLTLPVWLKIVLGVFLIDLNGYAAHRLFHHIPLFWRFHRVHHSDVEMDASTTLRIHPFEFICQTFTQVIFLPLIGIYGESLVLYSLITIPVFLVNHSNIRLPQFYEKYFSLLFVTPNWHRVHHSSYQPETDSNFGDAFSIWDRLFKTRKSKAPEDIQYGLETLRDKKDQTFWGMLVTPFKPIKKKSHS